MRILDRKYFVDPENGFTCRYVRSETERFVLHSHNYYEIFLIVRNNARHIINGNEEMLPEGSLIFIRDFDKHGYRAESGESFDFINLAFGRDVFENLCAYLGTDFCAAKFLSPISPPRANLDAARQKRLSDKMYELNFTDKPELRRIKFKKLLIEIFNEYLLSDRDNNTAAVPFWLSSLCKKMQSKDNFSMGSTRLIELSGKSREHLSRSMKKYLGVTPSEYINELKLRYAENLLKYSNFSVTDICFECGFMNISWFYTLFKQKYSLSPSEFRKVSRSNPSRQSDNSLL